MPGMAIKANMAKHDIDVPLDRIAELARTSLARYGWHIDLINEGLREITANLRRSERRSNISWNYEYHAVLTWKPGTSGATVKVSVEESQNEATKRDCESRCYQIIAGIVEKAQELKEMLATAEVATTYGSARWATAQDIESKGYKTSKIDSRQLLLGPGGNGSYIAVPAAETYAHCILQGATGTGKTSRFILPQAIERTDVCALITEATAGNEPPDVYHKSAGWRHKQGHEIYYFNPDDMTSVRINPVDQVTSVDKAQHIANLIVENTSKKNSGGDQIWEVSERHLLTALLLYAAGEHGNLGMVRRLLRQGPNGIGLAVMNSVYVEAKDEYLAFFKNSTEGFRNGVTSGLMQRLNLWINPRIVALTETTDFEPSELMDKLFTFYLAVPAQKTHLKPLAALVFNYIMDIALDSHMRHQMMLILDEFTNFGRIPGMADKLTLIRHRKIGAMFGIQDYIQLEKVYGKEDATLLANQPGTKIYLRPRDLSLAKKISESLGTKTVVDRKVSSSGQIVERELGRPLMNASEVMAMADDKAIVLTPSVPPMLLDCFSWQDYTYATTMEPPVRRELVIDEALRRACKEAAEPVPATTASHSTVANKNKEEELKLDGERASKPMSAEEDAAGEDVESDGQETKTRKELDVERSEDELHRSLDRDEAPDF
jgi:type IV secretion system protein VirD4